MITSHINFSLNCAIFLRILLKIMHVCRILRKISKWLLNLSWINNPDPHLKLFSFWLLTCQRITNNQTSNLCCPINWLEYKSSSYLVPVLWHLTCLKSKILTAPAWTFCALSQLKHYYNEPQPVETLKSLNWKAIWKFCVSVLIILSRGRFWIAKQPMYVEPLSPHLFLILSQNQRQNWKEHWGNTSWTSTWNLMS